jgi:signal transduction histidine kinase
LNLSNNNGHNASSAVLKPPSLQVRLPVLISVLLLIVMVAYTWVSYIGIRDASMDIGNDRVTSLAVRLSTIFKQSITQLSKPAQTIAAEPAIRGYLAADSRSFADPATAILENYQKKDTLNRGILLLNAQRQTLFATRRNILSAVSLDYLIRPPADKKTMITVGRFVTAGDSIYYPVIARVTDHNKLLGYVLKWQVLKVTQKSIDQFAQLLGNNGKMYFGNDDGRFWTDLVRPVSPPPVSFGNLRQVALYARKSGEPLLASMRSIPNSSWMVLVEAPSAVFLKPAHIFLRRMTGIGTVLVLVGGLAGWLMSRNITKSLAKLTAGASAVAQGRYDLPVQIDREDELGQLAGSFNAMASQIKAARNELEQRVQERTKELEAALTDLQQQKETEKKKDEFISIVSHELKTPLTSLSALVQLASAKLKNNPDDFLSGAMEKAGVQVKKMTAMINGFLNVSRLESGKIPIDRQVFKLDEAITDVIKETELTAATHQIKLGPCGTVSVFADKEKITSVITNLVSNALKYSPKGSPIDIECQVTAGAVRVSVQDEGIGISKDDQEQLFERYYRVENDDTKYISGFGIGLYLSAEIVRRHGGSIGVISEPGAGSTFYFTLPLSVIFD